MTAPTPPHAPLDPTERALAERIARLGPHGEPDARLDARILAAAADALARESAHAPRPHARRWPWALGIAASLALAIGLAWQLRPPPAPTGAPLPVREAAPPATSARTTTSAAPTASTGPSASVPTAPAAKAPTAIANDTADSAAAPTTAIATPAAPADTAMPAEAAASASAPVPPPPPPPMPMPTDVGGVAPAVKALTLPAPPRPAQTRSAQERAANRTPEVDADAARGLPTSRDAGDEPPATADEPAVQAAWLARIRTLRANGDDAAARDSLAEYRRRYPDAPLPADLDAWWRDDAAQKH